MKASDSLSSLYNIIVEDDCSNCMIELDNLYYIVNVDGHSYQFRSVLPADMPEESGCNWVANWSEGGLKHCANGRSRKAAMAQWEKHILGQKPLTKAQKKALIEVSLGNVYEVCSYTNEPNWVTGARKNVMEVLEERDLVKIGMGNGRGEGSPYVLTQKGQEELEKIRPTMA